MATFLNDTFTDTDATTIPSHTGETGATWTVSAWNESATPGSILSNGVRPGITGGPRSAYYASGTPIAADYQTSAVFVRMPVVGGVIARMESAGATPVGYSAYMYNGSVFLSKWSGGLVNLTSRVHGLGAAETVVGFTLTVKVVGTTISSRLQRASDGFYLGTGTDWTATPTDWTFLTDSSFSSAGAAGYWLIGGANKYMDSISAADIVTQSFIASPASIADESSGATITLTGTNTTWTTGGSEFSVSGLSGVSKVSENVTSSTAATLVVETVGGTPGTLTITDADSVTQTITVNPLATTTIPVTDANIMWSPYNWFSDGAGALQANNVKASSTYAQTTSGNAYVRFKVSAAAGPATILVGSPASAAVSVCIDNGAWAAATISSGEIALGTLTAGDHTIELVVITTTYNDLWTNPTSGIRLTGFKFTDGTVTISQTSRPARVLVYGDSISLEYGSTAAMPYSWARLVAAAIGGADGAEFGIVAYGGQGWNATGLANVPGFAGAWDDYRDGVSRLVSGALSPAPDWIIVNHGHNDSGGNPPLDTPTVDAWLAAARAAAPDARIVLVTPVTAQARAAILAATLPDSGCYIVDLGSPMSGNTGRWTTDGLHLNPEGHANIAARAMFGIMDETATGSAVSFGTFGASRL